jgi:hypothetical protein
VKRKKGKFNFSLVYRREKEKFGKRKDEKKQNEKNNFTQTESK